MSKHLWLLTGPLAGRGEGENPALRKWLARGDIRRVDNQMSTAARLMRALGHSQVDPDRAAYRYLAHAKPAASRFIAAADPVYLEPRLDHLCLFRSPVSAAELERLRDHVNNLLADDGHWSLELHGNELYYVGSQPVPTSTSPSEAINGLLPNQFMPDGQGAADYRRRLSEFEMALHEHPVNLTRVAQGLQPINSLWLWGGGEYSPLPTLALPALLSNDSHLRGVWRAAGCEPQALPEQFAAEGIEGDTVIGPIGDAATLATIEIFRDVLRSGGATALTILSLDGFVIHHRKRDWLRVFRRPNKELG